MDYKKALYDQYVSSHESLRQRVAGPEGLKLQARSFRQHFGKLLPANKDALIADLGCGSGGLVWWLGQSGFANCKGIDGSPEQIEIAHRLGIMNVSLGDVFTYLHGEHDHAALFARDLVEHFDKQSVFTFLGKCFESLAPGGCLIVQVPNAESPYFGRVRYGDFTHEVAFTPSSIGQLLRATGFQDIEILPWRPAITGLPSLLRFLAWRVIEPLLMLPIILESGGRGRIVTMNLIAVGRRPQE